MDRCRVRSRTAANALVCLSVNSLGLTGLVGGVCFNVQCCALEAKNGAQWARRRAPSLFPFSRTPARKGPRVVQSHFQPYRRRTTDHLRRTEYQTRDVNQDARRCGSLQMVLVLNQVPDDGGEL